MPTPSPRRRQPRFARSVKVTSVGIRYLLLCLAVGLAAVNTGNNLLYLLFAMMLSLILVSGILSERTLRSLSALCRLTDCLSDHTDQYQTVHAGVLPARPRTHRLDP